MIILILFLAFLYYRFACYRPFDTLITLPLSTPQDPPPSDFGFSLSSENDSYTLQQSNGDFWIIQSHPDYYIKNNQIFKKDQCFGEEDGYKFKAKGKPLYAYIQAEKLRQSKDFQFQISNFVKKGHVFYFECQNQTISGLEACVPGHTFRIDDCFPVNPCLSGGHNQLYPDPFDKSFYNRCVHGQIIHKQCPPNNYFFKDSCRDDLTKMCTGKYYDYIPLGPRRYIHCEMETPYIKTCPEGTYFSKNECRSDICVGKKDGFKVGLTGNITHPQFRYTTLYTICKNGEPTEIVKCQDNETDRNELDLESSVFDTDAQDCRPPILCENVIPVDPENMIVPVYEKRKYAKDWSMATLFDSVMGYKCNGSQKIRTAVQPGNVIDEEYREVDGCTKHQTIPMEWNSYFDCSTRKPVVCPKDEFFDGLVCRKKSKLAHSLGGIDLSQYDGLSPHNKWMTPLVESDEPKITCSAAPETHYISGYNICAHPECSQFPFLKHVDFGMTKRDGENMCLYEEDKIKLIYQHMDPRYDFNFWQQRRTVEKLVHDPCVVGAHTKSGIFSMDSVLYMTCDETQPFVFCPSPVTQTIAQTSNLGNYACVPKDEVYSCTIPEMIEFKYFPNEIESISARKGSRIDMDGKTFQLQGNVLNNRRIHLSLPQGTDLHTVKSNYEIIVKFQRLPTYPINSYIENKTLMAFTDPYSMKFNRSTEVPLTSQK